MDIGGNRAERLIPGITVGIPIDFLNGFIFVIFVVTTLFGLFFDGCFWIFLVIIGRVFAAWCFCQVNNVNDIFKIILNSIGLFTMNVTIGISNFESYFTIGIIHGVWFIIAVTFDFGFKVRRIFDNNIFTTIAGNRDNTFNTMILVVVWELGNEGFRHVHFSKIIFAFCNIIVTDKTFESKIVCNIVFITMTSCAYW